MQTEDMFIYLFSFCFCWCACPYAQALAQTQTDLESLQKSKQSDPEELEKLQLEQKLLQGKLQSMAPLLAELEAVRCDQDFTVKQPRWQLKLRGLNEVQGRLFRLKPVHIAAGQVTVTRFVTRGFATLTTDNKAASNNNEKTTEDNQNGSSESSEVKDQKSPANKEAKSTETEIIVLPEVRINFLPSH
jgi:hypothetical protein